MRYIVTCAFIICLSFISRAQLDFHSFSKVPPITNFSTTEYLGGIQNWSITQNSRGFIYIANNFGLLEFDGASWRNYQIPNGTRTQALYVDSDDRIFVGGQNEMGYLSPNERGELIYTDLLQLIARVGAIENVWRIFEKDDIIYFNTQQSVFRFDGERIEIIPFTESLGFLFEVSNNLYLHAHNSGLYKLTSGEFRKWNISGMTGSETVVEILPFMNTSFLIFTAEGEIFHVKDDIAKSWNESLSESVSNVVINTAAILSNNSIAIGTQNQGLIILDPKGNPSLHLNVDSGLNSNTVQAMFEDQFSNLWLGLNNGIGYLELGLPFSFINKSVGLQGAGYTALIADDHLYLGTNTGLYAQKSRPPVLNNPKNAYNLVDGSEGQVYSIQNLREGNFMGHHTGSYKISGNQAEILSETNTSGTWKFLNIPQKEDLLAGTYNGFRKLSMSNGEYQNIDGFYESSRLFEFENDTTVWMAHGFKGAFRIQFDKEYNSATKADYYGEAKGFPSNILINVFKLGDELVFTAERGIYKYENRLDIFVPHIELEEYLGNDSHISYLGMDSRENIYYMRGSESIGVLQKANNKYIKEENIFKKINKYITDDLQNISILDHENILIGSKDGFIHYNPQIKTFIEGDFKAYIRKVDLNPNDSLVYGGGSISTSQISLPSDHNSFRIEFSSPYFDGMEDIQFQYKLDGFEEEWSNWTKLNTKEYTNLSTGEYVFNVRAKNIYGNISETDTVAFKIYPPWYLTKTAYGIYITVILSVFGISLFWLDYKHKEDKQMMAQNSLKRIEAKDLELKTISEESENALSELKNEKLRAEIDHKNRELTSSTMHLLNKNEVMLGIKNKLEDLEEDSQNKNELRKIMRTIDNSIEDDQDWSRFTQYFDQVHGDFLKRIKEDFPDITPQETRLAAFLRMNLNTKNIAQLTNISVRGVEVGRYRLRKKLKIDREINLTSFLMDF